MGFADAEKKPTEGQKPIILCDCSGTLFFRDTPNQELIILLHRAEEMGFDVRPCTSIPAEVMQEHLKKITNLKHGIIDKMLEKDDILPHTFSNVVAIIDDNEESYMSRVKVTNPDAQYFKPRQTEELLRHLNTIKKGSIIME